MNIRTRLLRLTFVALIVALSVKTIMTDVTGPFEHTAIAAAEIAAAFLLLSKRLAPIAGVLLAAICIGVAIVHLLTATQVRFDLLIYSTVALYLGFPSRAQGEAAT